jgi:hypothetical protein
VTVKIPRPDLAMVALCALSLAGIVACTLLGVTPPPVLEFVAMTALGAGGGIAVQQQPKAAAQEDLPSRAARAAAPAANLPAPAPQPLTAEPPTGVFRAATHAP